MANKPSVMLTNGGLWNTQRPQFSTETSKLLKSKSKFDSKIRSETKIKLIVLALMDESRVNNFQRRQLTSHMLRELIVRQLAFFMQKMFLKQAANHCLRASDHHQHNPKLLLLKERSQSEYHGSFF